MIIDRIDVVPMAATRGDYTSEMERQTRDSVKKLGMMVGDSIDDALIYATIIAKSPWTMTRGFVKSASM